MRRYRKDEPRDDLEHWPFDNKASDYVIVQGNPVASGHIDYVSPDGLPDWECGAARTVSSIATNWEMSCKRFCRVG